MKVWRRITIILVLILGFFLRAPFFSMPLDYDEGTYAFFAFFSRGEKFYSSLPIGRLPGIIFTYRFLNDLFPGQIIAFRIASTALVVLAAFGIYKLGRLLVDEYAGIFSSLIFVIFSSQISIDSPANTEFFMVPFMVISVYFFWVFLKSKKMFWLLLSGLCVGIAIFYKQVAVFEIGFLGLWLLAENLEKGRLKFGPLMKQWLALGFFSLIPFLAAVTFFLLRGELADFWWQSFGSGGPYVKYAWEDWKWFGRLKNTVKYLWGAFWPFWLLSSGGLIIALIKRKKRSDLFLIGWLIFSLMGAFFNGWFFPHYLIQIIPAASLLGGLFISRAFECEKLHLPLTASVVLILSFVIGDQLSVYTSYFRFLRGDIDKIEYYKQLGIDTGEAGWLPFYDSAEYLKNSMAEEDTLFVWSTTPLLYYLVRKYPPTSFVQNYPLLGYEFMLPTARGWEFDFVTNRKELTEELSANPPTHILMHVNPEQVFDQMSLFKDFSNFVALNYDFENQFGNVLIFRVKEGGEFVNSDSAVIPLEIIKRFSAVIGIETKGGETKLVYEPMINPNGVLRSFEVVYSEIISIDFEPISTEFLGRDGSDFVGNATPESSGNVDLHIRVKGPSKQISFVRVKMGDRTWNNKQYGVNSPIKIVRSGEIFDLYFEPPSNWEGQKFEIYFIYEDGSLAKTEVI